MKNLKDRDFVGYGENTPDPKWPNNAKIAISFVVNYEEGGEHYFLDGDKHSEVFLNETPGGKAKEMKRDINMETQYEYGSRAGIWRLLRMFKKYAFKFTCYAVGRAVEENPAAIQAMERDQHEIASHNHKWIDYDEVGTDIERQHVHLCIEAIKSATGKIPRGWYTGRISQNSRSIVSQVYKEMGYPLLYLSDSYADDLPYWVADDDNTGILILPYTLDQNDMKFCVPPGFGGPESFFNYLKNAFDVLYQEGKEGSPKMMSVGLHCRLAGKPGRASAVDKFMAYVASHPDVWVATREEIAIHWRKVHPFKNLMISSI